MSKTISIIAPEIVQYFDRHLLGTFLDRIHHTVSNSIVPRANKKIRPQDVKKIRQFNALLNEFQEVYERKKIEEADYKAKVKEETKKRDFQNAGQTSSFKKMAP